MIHLHDPTIPYHRLPEFPLPFCSMCQFLVNSARRSVLNRINRDQCDKISAQSAEIYKWTLTYFDHQILTH